MSVIGLLMAVDVPQSRITVPQKEPADANQVAILLGRND